LLIESQTRWLTAKTVAIEWSLLGSTSSDSHYIVQRSEFFDSEFTDITTPVNPSGVLSYVDTTPPNVSELGTFYYKVQLRDNSASAVIAESTSRHPRRDRPRIALEIVRRNNLLLRRFAGIRGFLLTKKEAGIRCGMCWDAVKERRFRSHCSACGDTGWDNGLSSPIPIFISSSSPTETQTVGVLGASEEISRQVWTSNYPLISAGDIIILDYKEIFRVDSVQPITFRETIVSQNLKLTSMSKDREYSNIPLPSFDEFTDLDLIHRQYGGVSTEDPVEYKNLTTRLGGFSIHDEGDDR
jgi:hypothetical protein